MKSLRLILMGTGPFAVPAFESLRRSRHEIVGVVTKPEPPIKSRKGPPPAPVRTWAGQNDLQIYDPQSINSPDAVELLQQLRGDLLVVCDYGQILKPEPLSSAPLGGINLHGSLLPKFRGAAPVQRALLEGELETGVTVIHMTPKLDGGPIVGTRTATILDTETAGELEDRLSQLGVELVGESIEQICEWDGETALGAPQDASQVTRAPRLSKQEADIDFSKSARELSCHVRGMQPWPIAFTHLPIREDKPPLRLAVLEVCSSEASTEGLEPGQILGGKQLAVACGDAAVELVRVRPAGKREMTGEEFMRGYQLQRGTRFVPA
ncbi:MAG: methionyl-tRNA formyltransferase [Planctomycetota bacterium]